LRRRWGVGRFLGWSTCSREGRSASSPSSLWASCPSSTGASSCSCSLTPSLNWTSCARKGSGGRRKIAQYTRYATFVAAFLQGWGYLHLFMQAGALPSDLTLWVKLRIVLSLMAGTAFLMWLGERINERGHRQWHLPHHLRRHRHAVAGRNSQPFSERLARQCAFGERAVASRPLLFTLAFIVYIQQSQRRIPVTLHPDGWWATASAASPVTCPSLSTSARHPHHLAIALASFPVTVINSSPQCHLAPTGLDGSGHP